MAPISLYQVFCDLENNLHGNTSSVIFLKTPLSEKQMQQLASDLCQPATTFLHPLDSDRAFGVRWFAPDAEIDVCGHGAAAAISFLADRFNTNHSFELHFGKGKLTGKRVANQSIQLMLPAFHIKQELEISDALKKGLGVDIEAHYQTANKNIVLVSSQDVVRNMQPNFEELRRDGHFGYIVTAPGKTVDFVSRTLVPHVGQLEDPATGSSHATITPFWAGKLQKSKLEAIQLSDRGGRFSCELNGEECLLTGQYRSIMNGEISL